MSYQEFRERVHERVCIPARSCTCPDDYGPDVLAEAQSLAKNVHAKREHPGTVENCRSPHDVICKAVF